MRCIMIRASPAQQRRVQRQLWAIKGYGQPQQAAFDRRHICRQKVGQRIAEADLDQILHSDQIAILIRLIINGMYWLCQAPRRKLLIASVPAGLGVSCPASVADSLPLCPGAIHTHRCGGWPHSCCSE